MSELTFGEPFEAPFFCIEGCKGVLIKLDILQDAGAWARRTSPSASPSTTDIPITLMESVGNFAGTGQGAKYQKQAHPVNETVTYDHVFFETLNGDEGNR